MDYFEVLVKFFKTTYLAFLTRQSLNLVYNSTGVITTVSAPAYTSSSIT